MSRSFYHRINCKIIQKSTKIKPDRKYKTNILEKQINYKENK